MRLFGSGKNSSQNEVRVGYDGRLWGEANQVPRASKASWDDKELWSWVATYDPDAGDTIILVQNTSLTKLLRIEYVAIGSDTASRYYIHCPATSITVAGTAVTAVRLNNPTGGGTPPATAKEDETGNSTVSIIHEGHLAAGDEKIVQYNGSLVLGYLESVAVDLVTAATLGTATVVGWFEEE